MTIKELKGLIQDVPDEAEVYIGDEDMGEEVKATDIYYAVKGTSFQYKWSIIDKSQIKAIEITGFF